MLFLLSLACTEHPDPPSQGSPPASFEPLIELEQDGTSLGEMLGGFGFVRPLPADDDHGPRKELRVVLATYPDPCDALTGYYQELAAFLGSHPDPSRGELEDAEDRAAEWLPIDPYDTVTLSFSAEGAPTELLGEFVDMEFDIDPAWVRVEQGRTGNGRYDLSYSIEGSSVVDGLDPVRGHGETTLVQTSLEVAGTLDFSFEVPVCSSYGDALQDYEQAQDDGSGDCRSVSCR